MDDFKDSTNLAVKLRDASDSLSLFLQEQFSLETQQLLSEYDDSSPPSESLQSVLIQELNQLLQGPSLYDEDHFAHVTLSQEIQQLVEQSPEGEDLIRLSRWLLEEAYPQEIAQSHNKIVLFLYNPFEDSYGIPSLLSEGDFKDSASLAVKLRDASDTLSLFLQEQFSPTTQDLLSEYDDSSPPSGLLQEALIDELNELLQGPSLYDETRFAHVTLSQETLQLIQQSPEGVALIRLNRRLLEEAYPQEIAKLSQIGPADLEEVWNGYDNLGPGYNRKEDFYVINETYYCVERPQLSYLNYWDEGYIQEMLRIVDNIYFWRIFNKNDDIERNNTLMSSLDNRVEHFIAAVRPQYFRRNTGGCNPSDGTELLRSVWHGRVQHPDYQPEWIVLSTWDDYAENTVFEASKFNRGFYASLIHSLANGWKNVSLPEPELWLTLPTVIMRGEKIHMELVELNNPLSSRSFTIELYDPVTGYRRGTSGNLSVPDEFFYDGAVQVYSFDISSTAPMYTYVSTVYPRIIIEEPDKSTITAWGPPIRISEHHILNPLYQSYRVDRFRWPKIGKFTSFSYENLADGGRRFHCAFQAENKTGQSQFKSIEFLTINKRTIQCTSDFSTNLFSFFFDSKEHHEPMGLVYARIDYQNGDVFYSKPAIVDDNAANEITSLYDISDKIEWTKIGEYDVSFKEALVCDWNLVHKAPVDFGFKGKIFKKTTDAGAYGSPLYLGLGPNNRVFSGTEACYPQFVQGHGYYFDGIDDVMRFPEHILPAGTLRIQIEINASELKDAFLLFHRNNAVKLKLFTDGSLEFTRGTDINGELITARTGHGGADQRVSRDTDHVIVVGDYGDQLRIYLDGELIAKNVYGTSIRKYIEYTDFWTDLMLVGGTYNEAQYFHGYIKRIKVYCSNPIDQPIEVTMELPGGWSMISLPVRPEVATLSTLFPGAVVVYKYQKGLGYVRVQAGENLEIGIGYWILLDNAQTYVIRGTAITEYTIPVADGWYMIGGCSDPAQKMVTDGRIDVIYEYTQSNGYTRLPEAKPLEPEKGYWILLSHTSGGAAFTASTLLSKTGVP